MAVLPLASEIDAKLNPKELKIEFTRSSGAGGQGVNTSDSACRVTHLPTGTQVKAQDERSPVRQKFPYSFPIFDELPSLVSIGFCP